MYGKELILDLHDCETSKFTRKSLGKFLTALCKLIDMKPEKRVWWDDFNVPLEERQSDPNLVGITVVQFILTSNITVHTLDLLGSAYLNLFSCKDFDTRKTVEFIALHFGTVNYVSTIVERT